MKRIISSTVKDSWRYDNAGDFWYKTISGYQVNDSSICDMEIVEDGTGSLLSLYNADGNSLIIEFDTVENSKYAGDKIIRWIKTNPEITLYDVKDEYGGTIN